MFKELLSSLGSSLDYYYSWLLQLHILIRICIIVITLYIILYFCRIQIKR